MFRNNFPKNRLGQNRSQGSSRRMQGHPFMMRQQEQVKTSLPEKINNGVGGLSKVLTNAQQVLKVVDSAAPMVKEYAPIVKNIPNMYRLLKAFKDIENQPQTKAESNLNQDETISHENMVKLKPESSNQSNPRLYI